MRRSRKWNATLETAQRGEVKHVLKQASDPPLPRRLLKVAIHLLDRRGVPSSSFGMGTCWRRCAKQAVCGWWWACRSRSAPSCFR